MSALSWGSVPIRPSATRVPTQHMSFLIRFRYLHKPLLLPSLQSSNKLFIPLGMKATSSKTSIIKLVTCWCYSLGGVQNVMAQNGFPTCFTSGAATYTKSPFNDTTRTAPGPCMWTSRACSVGRETVQSTKWGGSVRPLRSTRKKKNKLPGEISWVRKNQIICKFGDYLSHLIAVYQPLPGEKVKIKCRNHIQQYNRPVMTDDMGLSAQEHHIQVRNADCSIVCVDNSWRSTTLPGADSASSNQTLTNEHEWVLEKLR